MYQKETNLRHSFFPGEVVLHSFTILYRNVDMRHRDFSNAIEKIVDKAKCTKARYFSIIGRVAAWYSTKPN